MTTLAPIALADYDRGSIRDALAAAVDALGGWQSVLGEAAHIVLKPNFVVPEAADKWATTHPDVYMAVADLLLAEGRQVTIGESPAFGSTEGALKAHGVLDECRDRGIGVRTFAAARPMGGLDSSERFDKLTVTGDLDGFDAMINLPKIKVHQQMVFTGAVKNLYGCVPGKRKAWRHLVCNNDPVLFGRMLLATAKEAAPVLNIGDGIVAMHRKGPRGGDPYPLGRLLVSQCPLEHDWLQCQLMGIPHVETPLFQAVDDATRSRLQKTIASLLSDHEGSSDLLRAFATPIRFSPYQMLRSVYRSAQQQMAESKDGL